MWEEIFSAAAANGLFAMLFVGILIYVLRDGKNREVKYQEIIRELSASLNVVKEIKEDVKLIKDGMK